jgi:DNA polymerase-3 subunit delta'
VEEGAQQIKVDQIRGLIESLGLKSYRSGFKVGIIEGAELLNANGANAFLKTLEEPTANTVLILIAARSHRLPATIASRCLRITLTPPPADAAIAWLSERASAQARAPAAKGRRGANESTQRAAGETGQRAAGETGQRAANGSAPRGEGGGARSSWAAALSLAGGAPLLAAELADIGIAELDADMQDALRQLAAGSVDVTLLAERWARTNPALRITWLENWITRRVQAALAARNSQESAEPVRLPAALLKAKIQPLFEWLDALREYRRLGSTGVNQQLALEALLLGGRAALAK